MKPFIVLLLLILAGCSTAPAPVTFPVSPVLTTASAGGEMIISWKSKPDEIYNIYFSDTEPGKKSEWKLLPQGSNLKGDGTQITIRDTVQKDPARRYLLFSGNQKPF